MVRKPGSRPFAYEQFVIRSDFRPELAFFAVDNLSRKASRARTVCPSGSRSTHYLFIRISSLRRSSMADGVQWSGGSLITAEEVSDREVPLCEVSIAVTH